MRTVVKAYRRPDDSLRYVRHLAFERRFRRYGHTWYVEIIPTYFFSTDGYWESAYAAKHRSGIKRIERHNDVRRHVETWTWILRGEVDLGGMTPDPNRRLLEFGPPAQVELDNSIDEEMASPERDAERTREGGKAA
jgi:hypothetical protein